MGLLWKSVQIAIRQNVSSLARRASLFFAWRASNVNDPVRGASDVSAMRTPSATTLLEVSHLCKSFGGTVAVDDLSFQVEAGDFRAGRAETAPARARR